MAGLLFVIIVPRKAYEAELNKDRITKIVISDKEKSNKASKLVDELKENKLFGSLRSSLECNSPNCDTKTLSESMSADCLHKVKSGKDGFYKSKSDNAINFNDLTANDKKKYLRSSWSELRQVIKPSRNKLKITRPGSGVRILASYHWDTPLETILSEVINRLDIKNATWNPAKNDRFWQVIFSLESGCVCEELLQVLRTFGIGSRHNSSVSVIPCTLYYNASLEDKAASEEDQGETQNDTTAWSRFSSSVRARTNLAQVLQDVRADAALTFDWLFLLVVAAFVAAIGLVENSTVILVASMLISPLMGPITAATLGTAVRNRSLQQMGVTHELLGLFLSLIIGFIFGLGICAVDERYGVGDWPTYEMMSRCEIRSLWVGVLVAIPSGAGVALAVLGEYTASLVGVAISASLLPPAVNAGLLWAMALVHLIFMDDDTRWTSVVNSTVYSDSQPTELAVLGAVSLCLTLVNIVCIFLAGVAVYKVKEVCPLERRDIAWWRTSKNFLPNHKRKNKNRDMPVLWAPISNWCNEKDSENNKSSSNLIQSDTVTYRRNKPLRPLYSPQSESIPAENCQNPKPSTDLTTEAADLGTHGNFSYTDRGKQTNMDMENNNENNNDKEIENNDKYPFCNMGFEETEDENKNVDSKESPTLETSANFTMNLKNYGIVLGNQSYDV